MIETRTDHQEGSVPTHDLIVLARTRRFSKLEGTAAVARTGSVSTPTAWLLLR